MDTTVEAGINLDEVEIAGVASKDIETVWPAVRPLIQSAADRSAGEYTSEDVLRELLTRQAQLYLAIRARKLLACAVTEIKIFPTKKVLYLWIVAGKHSDLWLEKLDVLEEWGKHLGCTDIEAWGRPGWGRVAKQVGLEVRQVKLGKKLRTVH